MCFLASTRRINLQNTFFQRMHLLAHICKYNHGAEETKLPWLPGCIGLRSDAKCIALFLYGVPRIHCNFCHPTVKPRPLSINSHNNHGMIFRTGSLINEQNRFKKLVILKVPNFSNVDLIFFYNQFEMAFSNRFIMHLDVYCCLAERIRGTDVMPCVMLLTTCIMGYGFAVSMISYHNTSECNPLIRTKELWYKDWLHVAHARCYHTS